MGCRIGKGINKENNSTCKDFVSNTSLHGARYLTEKSIVRRLFWLAALGIAFGFCARQVSKTTLAFMAKPFSTTLTVQRDQSQIKYFPAVTICNMNKISMKQYVLMYKRLGLDYESVNATDEQLRQSIMAIMALMTYRKNESEVFNAAKKELYSVNEFRERGPNFGNSLEWFSHTIEGMLSFDWLGPCKWKGQPCTAKNFSSFKNLQMGQCYTFNSGREGHPLLENSQVPGPTQGLRLKLNIEEQDHVTNFDSPMAGFKVLVHDQNEQPLIGEFGFAIQPGTHTFAAISVTKYQNLASPFKTDCKSPDIPYTQYFKYRYSRQTCVKQCLHDYIIEKCGCQPIFNITRGVELCSMQDSFECVFPSLYRKLPQNVSDCSNRCPRPCKLTKYDVKLSYASALSNAFGRSIPAYLKTLDKQLQMQLANRSPKEIQMYLLDNLAAIDIYFEDFSYTFIQQKPMYDTWVFLANIGGYTGLFLGMSTLTVLEFLDFAVMWIIAKIRRPSKDSQVEDGTQPMKNRFTVANDQSTNSNDAFSMDVK